MTIGERVKSVRKEVRLTMEKFGDRLGVGKSSISEIESDKRGLTDQMARSICREFGVSMDWLQNGTGQMFAEQPSPDLGDLVTRYHLDRYDQAFVLEYMKLAPEARAIVKQYMIDVLAHAEEDPPEEDDIETKVEEYRQALLADRERKEKAAAASSTSMPPAAGAEETA